MTNDYQLSKEAKAVQQRNFAAAVTQATIVFVVLVIGAVGMILAARTVGDPFTQAALLGVGAALLAGSLAFFLTRMFYLDDKRKGW